MTPKAYLETTIVSYLAASPSRDVVVAGHQQITRDWWKLRNQFELYVSAAVLDEAQRGDSAAVKRRMALLSGIPLLDLDVGVYRLSDRLLSEHVLPPKALVDAVHIAVATVHAIDYLVTWNCRHIANGAIRGKIERACRAEGLNAPTICTPEELMEI